MKKKPIWLSFFLLFVGIILLYPNSSYAQGKNVQVKYTTSVNSLENIVQPNYYEKKPILLASGQNMTSAKKKGMLPNTGSTNDSYILGISGGVIVLIILLFLVLDLYKRGGRKRE